MMAKARGSIVVGNRLIAGVGLPETIPTFVLDLSEASRDRAEFEVEQVAFLQTVAPVFHVVLLTRHDLFSITRPLAWPVEHIMAQEYEHRFLSSREMREYLDARVQLALGSYANARVVSLSQETPIALEIAELLRRPDLVPIVEKQYSMQPPALTGTLEGAIERLVAGRDAVVEGASGGKVRLTAAGPREGLVLIVGCSAPDAGRLGPIDGLPNDVCVVRAEFSCESSVHFESLVYSRIAEYLGRAMSVLQPWRDEASVGSGVAHWVDLAIHQRGAGAEVSAFYGSNYLVLSGSLKFDWSRARAYAAVRRASRLLSEAAARG